MYLLRPSHWFARAGASGGGGSSGSSGSSGGGGGRGGGSTGGSTGGGASGGGARPGGSTGGGSAGGGSTGGSSSGSGSTAGRVGGGGVSPASGKTGSTLRSGGSSSPGSSSRTISSSSRLGSSMRGPIWSRPSSNYYGGYRGSPRPLYPGYILLFGFWPIVWLYDYPDGAIPTNNTRPGGPLITAAITPPNSTATNTTYIIYGDTQSVEDMLPSLILDCSATNGSATGFNATSTDPIQTYREDSFALMARGLDQPGRNTTFEVCLNETIADNLLVLYSSWGQAEVGPVGAMWMLVAMLCFAMTKV